MKKYIYFFLVIILFTSGCGIYQNDNANDEVSNTIINNKEVANDNLNDDNKLNEDSNINNKENWLLIDLVEDNGALWQNRLLVNFNDILNSADLTIVEFNDILGFYENTYNWNDFSYNNSPLDISDDGTMLALFNFDSHEYNILDLKNNRYISDKEDKNKYTHVFPIHIYNKTGKFFIWNMIEDSYKQININEYNIISKKIYSPDKKDIVFIEKGNSNQYFFVFYNLAENNIYKKISIKDLKTDYVYLSQWHRNGEIYLNINNKAYKFNKNTEELTEIGKYLYHPILTLDEKYLIYSKPRFDFSGKPLTKLEDYNETGLFIRELESNKDYKIESEIIDKYFDMYQLYPSRIISNDIDYSKFINHKN